MVAICHQEIMQDIHLFTSQPKARVYDVLFAKLNTDIMEKSKAKTGHPGYPRQSLLCAFVVMKCEGFSQVSASVRREPSLYTFRPIALI